MMIDSKIYKGIEYIQLNELPLAQREKLTQTVNRSVFIKILIDGKIVSECLQYKDYVLWFNSVYSPKVNQSVATPVSAPELSFNTNQLVLNS